MKGKCFCAHIRPDVGNAEFLALLLSSPIGAQLVGLSARGSTRIMINLEVVKETGVPLPEIEQQRNLVAATNKERQVVRELVSMLNTQMLYWRNIAKL